MTFINVIDEAVKKHKNRPAFTMKMGYRTATFTFEDIGLLAKKTACFLQAQGIKKGDKVIIFAPNSPYWVALFFGCQYIGAIPVPLNIQSSLEQIKKIIEQTEAPLIFVHQFFKQSFNNIQSVTLDHLEALVAPYDVSLLQPASLQDDDLIEILYTSGTTGDPKGVMLTHRNICFNLEAIEQLIKVDLRHDRLLSLLPLSHIFEQMVGLFLPFSHGVHVIYAHSFGAIAELMRDYHITKIGAVPEFLHVFMSRMEGTIAESRVATWWFMVAKRIAQHIHVRWIRRMLFYPFLKKLGGKLDTIACGGAFLDPSLEEKWELMGIQILQGYGLTETAPCITTNTFDDHRFASVGKVIPGIDVKIGPDKEILVKGPNVFAGYYKNPEKTNEVFTKDGYFMTGDIGEFDADGFLFIKGRKKYMILSAGGQNVYPEDIETEVNKQRGVKDSCVVGIEANGRVEIHAVIVPMPGEKVDYNSVIEEANRHLASYQKINAWSLWPEVDFPRTVTRKVKKNDVIAWIQSKEELPLSQAQHTRLMAIVAQISGVQLAKIQPTMRLVADLQLDSLMRVELIVWLEQEFGISIDEAEITPLLTVEQLEQLIKTKKNQAARKPRLKAWPRWFLTRLVRLFLQTILFAIVRLFVRVRVHGLEHLKECSYPVLFMPNHVSYVDGIIFTMALPRSFRSRISFAAAQDVLYDEYKLLAPLADLLFNSFPIGRGTQKNIKTGLDFIGTMLDNGYSVVLFPEGHISINGGLQALQAGAGLLAVEMGVPVIPVRMEGLAELFPDFRFLPKRRGTVDVYFFKPCIFTKVDAYQEAGECIASAMKSEIKKI